MIGAPEAIICDTAGEKTPNNLRKCCGDIGKKLRVLGKVTPHGNKSELFIILIKEAVEKIQKSLTVQLLFEHTVWRDL